MKWTSALAIYVLFWVLSAFVVMPFGMRTAREAGEELVAGQADSAPHDFKPKQVALRTTIVSFVAFGLYYANYVQGWITPDMLDFFN
jgi:predicted secreted protein